MFDHFEKRGSRGETPQNGYLSEGNWFNAVHCSIMAGRPGLRIVEWRPCQYR